MEQTCAEMFRSREICHDSPAQTMFQLPPMPMNYYQASQAYFPWGSTILPEGQPEQNNTVSTNENDQHYQLSHCTSRPTDCHQVNSNFFLQDAYSLQEHPTPNYFTSTNGSILHPAMQLQYPLDHPVPMMMDYHEINSTYFSEQISHPPEELLPDDVLSVNHDLLPSAMQYQLNHSITRSPNYQESNPAYLSQQCTYSLEGETELGYPVVSNQNLPQSLMHCQISNCAQRSVHTHPASATSVSLQEQKQTSIQLTEQEQTCVRSTNHTAVQNQLPKNQCPSSIPQPQGIDPVPILKERENRITAHIKQRIHMLNNLLPSLPASFNNMAAIEVKSLGLLSLQKQLRGEVCGYMNSTALEVANYPLLYRRQKTQSLQDVRMIEELERQRRFQRELRQRKEHKAHVNLVLKHRKQFKEYHLGTSEKIYRLNKAVMVRCSVLEREQKKEQEKIGKERIKRLMAEDEDGYRKLIDQKKDKRLAFLLSQTDEYIKKLADMVKHHKLNQQEEASKIQDEKQNVQKSSFDMPVFARSNNQSNQTVIIKPGSLQNYERKHNKYSEANFSDNSAHKAHQKEVFKQSKSYQISSVAMQNGKRSGKDIITMEHNDGDEYNDYYNIAHALKEDVKEQASIMINGKLKEYQVKGLEWLVSLYNNNLNGILADEMGLGKTIQVIALITYLMEKKNVHGPHLIIVPLTTLSNWLLEFERWAPSVSKCEYKGSPNVRKQLATQLKTSNFNVVLTTYEYIIKDKAKLSKLHWKYMIIDEGHRMKNHHCKLTQILNTYYKTSHRLLMTGTPLQNRLPELWALLNFLLPSIFKSCDTFEQWFNAPFAMTGEKVELNDEEQILIIRRLHKVLCPFLLRRLKKEVEAQLPEKVEYVIKCDTSFLQHLLYQHMKTKKRLPVEDTSGPDKKSHSKTLMNTIMQLRKICNHPFLFPHIEEALAKHFKCQPSTLGPELYRASGKFELLDRILPKLQKTKHRVLLFCQMTTLMTIMEDYLCYRNIQYLRLDGTTKAEVRFQLLNAFNAPLSPYFIFLLSTRAGGIGLNLQAADTVIIFDSDWNPHQDLQAQDRAHRIGQQNEVRVLRLITVNSVEERILATAKYKLNIDGKVIQAGMFNQKSTEVQRCEFLQAILSQDEMNNEEENEVPDDEAINHMLARNEEEFETYQKMDRDNEDTQGTHKPRLIQESELPEWLLKGAKKVEKHTKREDSSPLGRGLRKRKRVDYSDTYADILWHFATENEPGETGNEKDCIESDAEQEIDDIYEMEDQKRQNKRKRSLPIYEIYEMEDQKRQSKRKRASPKVSPTQPQLTHQMKCVIDFVTKYKDDKRIICKAFYKLPTKQELPDYYEIIREPMDIRKIRTRIRKNYYCSLDDLEEDFMLMCKNAQTYNHEESLIYKDSLTMQLAFQKAKESIGSSECKETSEGDDESLTGSTSSSLKLKIRLGKDASENKVECIEKSSIIVSKANDDPKENKLDTASLHDDTGIQHDPSEAN